MQAPRVAVIGSGPAGLMAATILARRNITTTIIEKSRGPARKLLIAGASGLNVTNGLDLPQIIATYAGDLNWHKLLGDFSPQEWLAFIGELGFETYLGTSGRYFLREKKASRFVRAWIDKLVKARVVFQYSSDCSALDQCPLGTWRSGDDREYDAVIFAAGGASWLKAPLTWPKLFSPLGIAVNEFSPANVGYEVSWMPSFVAEVGRAPLKNVVLHTTAGSKQGDILVTKYGIEGTPVYFVGTTGPCTVDLKPDLTVKEIHERLDRVRENMTPLRRAQKTLALSPTAQALLFHQAPATALNSNESLARAIKALPLALRSPRPLTEAISSRGGIALGEVDEDLMLKKLPGVFVAGEMLDWHAPTGGFLIQACVSQGYAAALGVVRYLGKPAVSQTLP